MKTMRAGRRGAGRIALAVAACAAGLVGCIERSYVVRTEPAGARVVIDGEDRGLSPVETKFLHYGTRQIILSKEGYDRQTVVQPIAPPWYERFPIDFVVEMLWPATVHDRRVFLYRLTPLGEFDQAGLVERSEALKARVGVYGDSE